MLIDSPSIPLESDSSESPFSKQSVQDAMTALFAEQELFDIIGAAVTEAAWTPEQIKTLGPVIKTISFRAFGLGVQRAADAFARRERTPPLVSDFLGQ